MKIKKTIKNEDGQTLIEALVAILIITLLIVTTLEVNGIVSKASVTSISNDHAIALTTKIVSASSLFDCGAFSATDPSFENYPDETTAQNNINAYATHCWGSLSNSVLDTKGDVCNGSYAFLEQEGVTNYCVNLTTEWLDTLPGAPSSCPAYINVQPNELLQKITTTWIDGSVTDTKTEINDLPVPSDALAYHALNGSIVVSGVSGNTPVTLSLISASGVSFATWSEMRTPDSNGCVWFPYVPYETSPGSGQINYSISTPSYSTTLSLSPSSTTAVVSIP